MSTLREHSTSRVLVPVYNGQEVAQKHGYIEDTDISHPSCYVTIVQLQIAIASETVPEDSAKRMAFANWALSEYEENSQWPHSILWTDESHFSLHGTVNTQL